MGSYIPTTKKEQLEMLKTIGYASFDELFSHIPQDVILKETLDLPSGLSEIEVQQTIKEIANKNKVYQHIFRGAGSYNHYIPSIVKSIASKEEFLTAYTPYQAEISQGILQSIFEFQTMISELTGMDVANASVYDGASAAAEAIGMCREKRRNKAYIASTIHPDVLETIKTYAYANGIEIIIIDEVNGKVNIETLKSSVDKETACFYLQQPNFYGILEDASEISTIIHECGAKFIIGCHPISLGSIQSPRESGADIAVGEGQPLGIPISFGGPYLGFMATTNQMVRKLPGRIVGESVDIDGKRAFVLTLQAREQHIRREKASSNICSNQAYQALIASIYMATLGARGLEKVANQCLNKAHYLQKKLEELGFRLVYDAPFFNEFVTESIIRHKELFNRLEDLSILGGLPLDEHKILWCVTEQNSKESIDLLLQAITEVSK